MTLSYPVVPTAQVIISLEVAKWPKKPAQGENFEILFFKLEYYHFWCIYFKMNLTK